VILKDGSTINLSEMSLKMTQFIIDSDLKSNFSIIKNKQIIQEEALQWWWIAVPVIVVILIGVLGGVFIYMHRRNSVQAELAKKKIQDSIDEAEK